MKSASAAAVTRQDFGPNLMPFNFPSRNNRRMVAGLSRKRAAISSGVKKSCSDIKGNHFMKIAFASSYFLASLTKTDI
jgi:hypothetical protein